jgi:3-hydroxyacyl-[acyl-carrier-protein] dehydratase
MQDIQDIQSAPTHTLLKQAPPFLFVDRVVEVQEREIVCLKQVSSNEPFLQGHFPGNPIVPGVLLVEMCAQACLILVKHLTGSAEPVMGYLAKVSDFTFQHPARPGDSLVIRVSAENQMGRYQPARVEVLLQGSHQKVCRGRIVLYVADSHSENEVSK